MQSRRDQATKLLLRPVRTTRFIAKNPRYISSTVSEISTRLNLWRPDWPSREYWVRHPEWQNPYLAVLEFFYLLSGRKTWPVAPLSFQVVRLFQNSIVLTASGILSFSKADFSELITQWKPRSTGTIHNKHAKTVGELIVMGRRGL